MKEGRNSKGLELKIARLLKANGSSVSDQEVLADLEQLRAVRFQARGKAWLWRNELPGKVYDAFRAVGLRPPARGQPLT